MLNLLVSFSLRFRGIVISLACLLLAYGIFITYRAKLDVFPNFVQPQVVIQTEAPGLAPEQVEALVTRPVETAVNGLGQMESLRSESIQGLSIVTAVFEEGTDVFLARQMLAEKIVEMAGLLPLGVKPPRMTPLTSATMDLLKIGLVSEKMSPMDLRTFADWTLKPRLLAVAGVAKCSVFGGEVRQLQIQAHPDKLRVHDLALTDLLSAARLSSGVLGAGFIETKNQRVIIQTEGQALSADALANTVVIASTNGQSIRLRDVASVVEGAEPKFGDCLVQGKPGVLMTMSSQYGANTMDVTRGLEAALADMKPVFEKQGILLYPALHRPATFIELALANIRHSLLLGAAFVAVVLFLFLGHFRTAFISLTAIPLSLLTAIVLMDLLGVTLNTITLGGLAIAIGEVVDDAIIDVENIFRRLRENQLAAQPRSNFRVILDASLEVRTAVVYATFVVILVFVPVLTLTGLQGKFFAPLALSYILAIVASLLVALTLTPALSYLFFARGVRSAAEPRLQRWLKSVYVRLLRGIARWPALVMTVVFLVCLAAVTVLPFLGGEFLPEFREGHFVLQVNMAPGTSMGEMLRVGKLISEELLKDKRVDTVEQQAGRAEQGEDPWGPHRCEFHVELKRGLSGEVQEQMQKEIRELLEKTPGIQSEVLTFLGDRIGETITGETAPVVVNVFGDDLDVLDAKARDVAAVLRSIHGSADVQVKSPSGAPRMAVKLRSGALLQFGFRPVEVLDAIQTAFQGAVVAQSYTGSRVSDIAVILAEEFRRDPEAVGQLELRNANGLRVRLNQLADVFLTSGRHSIAHEGARRRQTVTCGAEGVDVATFVAAAKKEVARKIQLPAGVYVQFSGAAEARQQAQTQLLLHSGMAAVGILMLLSMVFGNWRNLLLVLINVPFALVGGVLFVYAMQLIEGEGAMSIGALVGFVTLFGITMRNSIMMISHFEHLVQQEGMAWGPEAALRGAAERLAPVLMTAIVTALGLLPLAIGAGEAGREIEGPMAIVILGGLITSTVLNLLVLPTLALRFGRFEKLSTNS